MRSARCLRWRAQIPLHPPSLEMVSPTVALPATALPHAETAQAVYLLRTAQLARNGYAPPASHSPQAKGQLPVDWEDAAHQGLRQQSPISNSPQARQ